MLNYGNLQAGNFRRKLLAGGPLFGRQGQLGLKGSAQE